LFARKVFNPIPKASFLASAETSLLDKSSDPKARQKTFSATRQYRNGISDSEKRLERQPAIFKKCSYSFFNSGF